MSDSIEIFDTRAPSENLFLLFNFLYYQHVPVGFQVIVAREWVRHSLFSHFHSKDKIHSLKVRNSLVEWRIINHLCPNINNSLIRMGFPAIPRKNIFWSKACVWYSKYYPDDVICALNIVLKLRRCHKKLWHRFESLMLGVCQFTLITCSRPWNGFTRGGNALHWTITNNGDMRYEYGIFCGFLILRRIIKFCTRMRWIAEKKIYDRDANTCHSWNLNRQELSMNMFRTFVPLWFSGWSNMEK